jgi:gliding motility-associated protein GldL
MGKYRRYKNRVEMYLSSDKGKRMLNFCYSWGASIVILGAMFKILHLPYGNTMLAVGMITEFFVFFVFGFERPSNDYRWEDVFPVLKSKNPLDRPDFAQTPVSSIMRSEANMEDDDPAVPASNKIPVRINAGGRADNAGASINVSEGNSQNLTAGIQKLLDAADRIAEIPQLAEATQKYLEQLSGIAKDMENFSAITHSLSNVSDGINRSSQGYVQQMEMLNRNISGLNTIYEVQLRSISSQISAIEHINAGLNRIKELYDGSIVDSSVFRSETEKMAQQLAQLNQVYSRLLQAMTVNMGIPTMQNPYQQNPYQAK